MSLPRLFSEMAWWYGQPEESFLKMPFRQLFRRANEMFRQQAKQELSQIRSAICAAGGKSAEKAIRGIESRAYGKKVVLKRTESTQSAINKGKQAVSRFYAKFMR